MNIQSVKLGDICDIKKGAKLNSNDYFRDGTYPVIGISLFCYGKSKKYNVVADTIICAVHAPDNEVGRITKYDHNVMLTESSVSIVPKDNNQIDNNFLFHYLKTIQKEISKLGKGFFFNDISVESLSNLELFIPPYDRQINFFDYIERMDKKIENYERELETLKNNRDSTVITKIDDLRSRFENQKVAVKQKSARSKPNKRKRS